ncbi:hypothetical protein VIM7927_00980 [Vibrio mangrovi]|nr:hypothetical protein VIM7927_00980 [Vibrio mangrovi]
MQHGEKLRDMTENQQKIIHRLSPYPALQATFQHCLLFRHGTTDLSFAVKGSLVSGEVDGLSDIDLYINVADFTQLSAVQSAFVQHIREYGELLTWFRAEHINMPDLLVFYLKVDGELVKVDAEIICLQQQNQVLPEKFLSLQENGDIFDEQPKERQQPVDFALIYRKFCAWQWFIYCKIARGELFQAARSIDFSREHALLILIRIHMDLPPMDGHRRIEQLLPDDILQQLSLTYPHHLNKQSMFDCLTQLSEIFAHYWAQLMVVKPVTHDNQLLERINQQIHEHYSKSGNS